MIQHNFNLFNKKFEIDKLKIVSSNSWIWSLRPKQPTLGSSIVSLKRSSHSFSDVTNEEMADLAHLIKQLEKTMMLAFDYDVMNYLMLMMVDKHVHYHVIPRYKQTRQFMGLGWFDKGWPTLPNLSDNQHSDELNILVKIQHELTHMLNN